MKLFLRYLLILITLLLSTTIGCSTGNEGLTPSDFVLIMDIRVADDDLAQNVNIRINADGRGEYERYNTSGTIQQDSDGMVTYGTDQIVDTGKFRLSDTDLMQLWKTLNDNHFFDLEEDFQMALGHSYDFIKVHANGQRHQVFNIGMAVPEMRAIVEFIQTLLPADVNVD